MKTIITLMTTVLMLTSAPTMAGKYVNSYIKKDGTFVSGHYKSDSDQYRYNNQKSQTFGGNQRDEFSSGTGATNKSNSTYKYRDNDTDGVHNPYDSKPDTKSKW